MTKVLFYEQLNDYGNIVAAFAAKVPYFGAHSGEEHLEVSAVYYYPNSECEAGCVSRDYLLRCHRVSEARARAVHPKLFKYLGLEEEHNG